MSDNRSWLQELGYVDDEVEGAVVLHRDLPNKARVTARLDEAHWSVSSFAKRGDETTISFVISGIADDDLRAKLKPAEAQLAWLYDHLVGK
jgi:hypothetical protein